MSGMIAKALALAAIHLAYAVLADCPAPLLSVRPAPLTRVWAAPVRRGTHIQLNVSHGAAVAPRKSVMIEILGEGLDHGPSLGHRLLRRAPALTWEAVPGDATHSRRIRSAWEISQDEVANAFSLIDLYLDHDVAVRPVLSRAVQYWFALSITVQVQSCLCPAKTRPAFSVNPVTRAPQLGCMECPSHAVNEPGSLVCSSSCSRGSFFGPDDDGELVCILCPAGHVDDDTHSNARGCAPCMPGKYADVPGLPVCKLCTPGYFAAGTGSEECEACPAGKFNDIHAATTIHACIDCPPGWINPHPGADICVECPSGTYALQGQSCAECPSGTRGALSGAPNLLACEPCPPGTFSQSGSSECRNCPVGTFSSTTNSQLCTECPPGSYSSVTGSVECMACPPGTFSSHSGSSQCTAAQQQFRQYTPAPEPNRAGADRLETCPADAVARVARAASSDACVACGFGRFVRQHGSRAPHSFACDDCPAGTYNDVFHRASACKTCATHPGHVCAVGQWVPERCAMGFVPNAALSSCVACVTITQLGALACRSCLSGEFASEGICVSCPPGRTGSECSLCAASTFRALPGACVSCPAHYYPVSTRDGCSACAAGTQRQSGGSCASCSANYFAEVDGGGCRPCPDNHISTTGRQACTPCPAGKFRSSSTATCQDCPEGLVSAPGTNCIAQCPSGSVRISGTAGCEALACAAGNVVVDGTCTACPSGTIALHGRCEICPAGTFAPTPAYGKCSACPLGKFQPNAKSTSCLDCLVGDITTSEGSKQCVTCPAGTTQYSVSSCAACPAGSYSAGGSASCTTCPKGKYGLAPGEPCVNCPPGTYGPSSGSQSCMRCAAGTASHSEGRTTPCPACPAGKFATMGSAACAACPPGSTSAMFSPRCELCSEGYFSPEPSEPCRECPAGKVSSYAQDKCVDCPAGTSSEAGSTECVPVGLLVYSPVVGQGSNTLKLLMCPAGSEPASEAGSATCKPCLKNFFSNTGGPCLPCQPGHVSSQGSGACAPCPSGTHRPPNQPAATDGCLPCAAGTSSSPGSVSCAPCEPGKFAVAQMQGACIACESGAIAPESGMTLCASVAPGKYRPHSSGALNCPMGSFSGVSHSSACTSVLPGTFLPFEGSPHITEAKACRSGSYLPRRCGIRADDCIPCKPGTYSTQDGRDSDMWCVSCPMGTWSRVPGASSIDSCIPCPPGTYSNKEGLASSMECARCPIGTYSDKEGLVSVTQCNRCPPLRSTRLPGATSVFECEGCAGGEEPQLQGGLWVCVQCAAGYWSALAEELSQGNCTACDPGKYSELVGAGSPATCQRCPQGTWQPAKAANSSATCIPCSRGKYGLVRGATTDTLCISCGEGKYGPDPGASSPAQCLPCPVGSYGNITGAATQAAGCQPCPAGTFGVPVVGGASSQADGCVSCPPGTWSFRPGAASIAECLGCGAGRYTQSWHPQRGMICAECPRGTYNSMLVSLSEENCMPCLGGHWQNRTAATSIADCLPCPAGTFSQLRATACQSCPPGTYSPVPRASSPDACMLCPPGTFQPTSGANSSARCFPCPRGTFREDVGGIAESDCAKCGPGTYNSRLGASSRFSCTPCPAGTWSEEEGLSDASSCALCPPNTFGAMVGAASFEAGCEACPIGTAHNKRGMPSFSACLGCGRGAFAVDRTADGNLTCARCPAGFVGIMVDAWEASQCSPCPGGTHLPTPGGGAVSDCRLCPTGSFAADGSHQCEPCPTGKYSTLARASSVAACVECGEGTYNDKTGSNSRDACRSCPPGTESPARGASDITECKKCPRGYFSLGGQAECTPCPAGTYLNATGGTAPRECTPCPRGTFSDYVGAADSSVCTPCPVGTFNGVLGAFSVDQCVDCDPGRVALREGSQSCERCPLSRYAAANHSACLLCPHWGVLSAAGDRCDIECELGALPSPGNTECLSCEPGTFLPVARMSRCLACEPGTFSTSRSSRCTLCPQGQYQASSGSATCRPCEGQRTTRDQGSRQIAACICPDGFHSPSINDLTAVCLTCPIGAVCVAGALPGVQPGFWYDLSQPDSIIPCLPSGACKGGRLTPLNMTEHCARGLLMRPPATPAFVRTICPPEYAPMSGVQQAHTRVTTSDSRDSDDQVVPSSLPGALHPDVLCAAGYEGERCSNCMQGYYRLAGRCEKCRDDAWILACLFIIVMLFVAGAASFVVSAGLSLAPITITLDFFQVLARFGKINVGWFGVTGALLELHRMVEFDIDLVSPECYVRTDYTTVWMGMNALPALLMLGIALSHALWLLIRCTKIHSHGLLFVHRQSVVGEVLLLAQMFFVTLTSKTYEVFDCSTLPNGLMVMDSDSSIVCFSSPAHRRLLAASVATTVFYVIGIPAIFYRVLRQATHEVRLLVASRQLLKHQDTSWVCLADRATLATVDRSLRRVLQIDTQLAAINAAASALAGRRGSVVRHSRHSIYTSTGGAWVAAELVGQLRRPQSASVTVNPMVPGVTTELASSAPPSVDSGSDNQPSRKLWTSTTAERNHGERAVSVNHLAIFLALAEARLRKLRRVAGTMRDRFKSKAWYWVLVIMLRRALIAAVTVLQSNRPTVQLGLLAGLLLGAFVLNRRARPYRTLVDGMVDNSDEQGFIMSKNRRKSLSAPQVGAKEGANSARTSNMSSQTQSTLSFLRREYFRFFRQSVADPNTMEDTSLLCAIGVVICAIMFKATRDSALTGWPLLPGVHFAFDVSCAAFIAVASMHMAVLAAMPIVTHLRTQRRTRPARAAPRDPATDASSTAPQPATEMQFEMPAPMLRPEILRHIQRSGILSGQVRSDEEDR